MDSSVSPKDEIWFLRVCHHISNAVYWPYVSVQLLSIRHRLCSLRDCIEPSCVCLQCYFRHVSAFARPSSGKLFICSICSYCCLAICIIRSLTVGYCLNAGGWELHFVQSVAKCNVNAMFWYGFSVWSTCVIVIVLSRSKCQHVRTQFVSYSRDQG